MKFIGIDMGSSFTKAVLLDLEKGIVVEHHSAPSPARSETPNPSAFEVSAQTLVTNVKKMIDAYLQQYNDIEGIVLSTQMHGFIYSCPGKEDAYVSWQDMRCLDAVPGQQHSFLDALKELVSPGDMEDHGVYLKPALGMCNLYTMLAQDPSLPRNGELFTLGSYVIHALTKRNVCHISNAAPLGLADVKHHCWDRSLIQSLGLDEIKLPELAENDFEVCGVYEYGASAVRVYPDYGDTQISSLGSDLQAGRALINIGTAAQVIRHSPVFEPGSYEVRPYFEGSYLNTISNMPGGRNLDVLIRFLKNVAECLTGQTISANEVWASLHPENGSNGLNVQTCFYKNPYYPDGGKITGITQDNLRPDTLFAAAYQDMAETYWKHIHELGGDAEALEQLICAGGVSWKNPMLVDRIAQVTAKPTCLSPIREEALNGLYRVSFICSGMTSSLDHARTIQI